MGMSASQARLIQLTARMSDLELEGQQINQQRLNLANQSSAIQEQALKMPVPTAPSTYDYMEPVYEGTDSDGNKVKAGSPSGGKLPVSTLSKDPINSMEAGTGDPKAVTPETKEFTKPEANNSITATFKKEVAVDCYKGGKESKQISTGEYDAKGSTVNKLKAALDNPSRTTAPQQSEFQKDDEDAYNSAHSAWANADPNTRGAEPQQSQYQTDDVDSFNAAVECWNQYTEAKADYESYTADKYYDLEESATGQATSAKGGEVPANYEHAHGLNGSGDPEAIKYSFTDAFGEEQKDKSAADLKNASSGYSKDQIDSMINKQPQLFTDAEGTKKLSIEDFDKATGKLAEGVKLYEDVENLEKIGGNTAYDLDEISKIRKETNKDEVDKLVQAIRNYEANATGRNGIADSAELGKWRITQDENGKLHAYKMGDDGKAQEFSLKEKAEAGWNTQSVNINEADFDENGVSNVDLGNGKRAFLSKSEQLNTTAYQAAEAEYKNKKAAYDHAQEEANQKVKKLQQIDKQLELKLKRLDTERNALNTEIDAVKKVIQDNTDKSFKTFSG